MEIYTGQPGLIRRGKKQIIKKLHYIKEPKEPILANASTMLEASKFLHQQPQEMPSLAKARQRRHKSHCLSLKTCALSRVGQTNLVFPKHILQHNVLTCTFCPHTLFLLSIRTPKTLLIDPRWDNKHGITLRLHAQYKIKESSLS